MDRLDAIYYRVKNELKYVKKSVQLMWDKEQKSVLNENTRFHNLHKGQRCFIVGNGPSLRELDLSFISDELVFTVNYFPKSPLYKVVRSNYHILMDPLIFDFTSIHKGERLQLLHQVASIEKPPICFAQYNIKKRVEDSGVNKMMQFYYVNSGLGIYDGYKRKFNLTKVSPGFSNVVLYATMLAMYMGVEDIYYIGCDMTGYEQFSLKAGKKVEYHVYEANAKDREMMLAQVNDLRGEAFFEGFYHMFREYRLLNDYANKQGVHLYNATKGGVLDSIERVDYESLFK